ncbi:hypothetical protein, partial [Enterococcus faecalis]|uniref:hypothetical protein n=1 Tax=Enterococcus faecalis TaxID=1351 RepID=UPI001AD6C934
MVFPKSEQWVEDMAQNIGCQIATLPVKYLGIPLGANPKRPAIGEPVIRKIEQHLSGWKARLLSRAGRLILIKVFLNNLPAYYLSLFKIPKMVAKRIVKLQRKFFWSGNEKSGLPSIKWEVIQRPKQLGGLDFT